MKHSKSSVKRKFYSNNYFKRKKKLGSYNIRGLTQKTQKQRKPSINQIQNSKERIMRVNKIEIIKMYKRSAK